MKATTYPSADKFLQTTQSFLETNEAANGLLLGICCQLKNAPQRMKTTPYFITVADHAQLALAAVMTPPHNLVIYGPENNPPALEVLVRQLRQDGIVPPGVLGPAAVAQGLAVAWRNATGVNIKQGMRQRIYKLQAVTFPANPPPGHLRPAAAGEIDLLTDWALAFQSEALSPGDPHQTRESIELRLKNGELYVWENNEQPVSMAAKARPISHAITVNLVYTPPGLRRRGYATHAVAALSQQLLDEGWKFCVLHTDLANPTSNHIYQSIGYRPVCDFNEYTFTYE